jgi:SAM-dependent methyltransferase
MLYQYGIGLGVKLLLRGKLTFSLPYLVRPVNYWRTTEYDIVWNEAEFHANDRILDIGSPKLLSLYLAKITGAKVFSTDIDNYFVKKQAFVRNLEKVSPDCLHIVVQDGCKLSYQDNSFNKVYSISVLEHIPHDGDTECIKEIARVMTKGGRCFITVPFWPQGRVDYLNGKEVYWSPHSIEAEDGQVFFQRRYSEEDLFRRIITPSSLTLKKLQYIGENVMINSHRELSDLLPAVTGPVQPLISKLFHTSPSDSWQALKKPLCAFIVLEK